MSWDGSTAITRRPRAAIGTLSLPVLASKSTASALGPRPSARQAIASTGKPGRSR
jgi:hypothetical protein